MSPSVPIISGICISKEMQKPKQYPFRSEYRLGEASIFSPRQLLVLFVANAPQIQKSKWEFLRYGICDINHCLFGKIPSGSDVTEFAKVGTLLSTKS